MLKWRASVEYCKRENEIYDKIRTASEEYARRSKSGMDTTEALRRLEAALVEFELFRYRQT
ncbi:MAG: hypothetical protein H6Q71_1705 [Firmicutes bacterium]|nr:hypothetical protein [Bacillota bacterium]